jgi:hypothetical protein
MMSTLLQRMDSSEIGEAFMNVDSNEQNLRVFMFFLLATQSSTIGEALSYYLLCFLSLSTLL